MIYLSFPTSQLVSVLLQDSGFLFLAASGRGNCHVSQRPIEQSLPLRLKLPCDVHYGHLAYFDRCSHLARWPHFGSLASFISSPTLGNWPQVAGSCLTIFLVLLGSLSFWFLQPVVECEREPRFSASIWSLCGAAAREISFSHPFLSCQCILQAPTSFLSDEGVKLEFHPSPWDPQTHLVHRQSAH